MAKETPISLANEGFGFLEAAKGVCTADGCPKKRCLLVYYYLVCHSIELSCKAILLNAGVPITTLKGVGHDLSKLISEVKRKKLGGEISEYHFSVVRMMSVDYRNRRYSYANGGYEYRLVMPPLPFEAAERISTLALTACKGKVEAGDE
ncbi:MAG: hypothetical protein ABJQ98_00185 [Alloalcanivorax venustensis]|jgi:hypothetical protein|uniref:hypothetical protein n=1 Tax=Gammaproteobacteria TaxID=1236 RepID=UPI003298CED6|tara:strand:+ start:185 stop:631 length:447 start_codon:yes stop_codon:yes gene_type:complete